ncbi:MAG: DUF4292 domain-containing protein [Acidobacteria bacterium]|nr:DUF4292 domain-containing protein [Acidobacteriota bacterium]
MLRKSLQLAAVAVFTLPLLGFPGCGIKKTERLPPEKVRPLQTATLAELVARLQRQQAAITSINARAELVPATGSAYSGVIEEYRDIRAFVLAQRRPAAENGGAPRQQIRVIGQAPIVRKNIFDMVADDERFQIFIPSRNKFIVGPTKLEKRSEKPIENLRPQHLLEALFLEAPWPDTPVLVEENEFGGQRYYALSEVVLNEAGRMALHRKWWFERSALELMRAQRFDPEGRLVADIHYSEWREWDGVRYPRRIELVRPQDDYRLTLILKELTLNQPLEAEKFHLEKPEGAELVELKRESEKAAEKQP